jgi:hypothetical protein
MPLVALVVTVLPLLWVKRWITNHLQELSMRWVGDPDVALIVYFVIVLPGVVVHELSHWLVASLLGVRVRKLTIGPVRKGRSRRVSLGSIRVGKVDPVRASLIGLAPLLGGSAVILLIGHYVFGVGDLTEVVLAEGVDGMVGGLERMVHVADSGLWLYLVFAVSNAMLPSVSDMATVRPVLMFLGIVAAAVLLVTGIPAIPDEVVKVVNGAAGYLATAFALTLVADAVFMVVIGVLTLATRWFQG